jgi:hypothetical protein
MDGKPGNADQRSSLETNHLSVSKGAVSNSGRGAGILSKNEFLMTTQKIP